MEKKAKLEKKGRLDTLKHRLLRVQLQSKAKARIIKRFTKLSKTTK